MNLSRAGKLFLLLLPLLGSLCATANAARAAFSDDGKRVFVVHDGIRIIDLQTRRIHTPRLPEKQIEDEIVAISRYTTGTEGWRMTGRLLSSVEIVENDWCFGLCASPDGKRILYYSQSNDEPTYMLVENHGQAVQLNLTPVPAPKR